jgi:hypothetical protein
MNNSEFIESVFKAKHRETGSDIVISHEVLSHVLQVFARVVYLHEEAVGFVDSKELAFVDADKCVKLLDQTVVKGEPKHEVLLDRFGLEVEDGQRDQAEVLVALAIVETQLNDVTIFVPDIDELELDVQVAV